MKNINLDKWTIVTTKTPTTKSGPTTRGITTTISFTRSYLLPENCLPRLRHRPYASGCSSLLPNILDSFVREPSIISVDGVFPHLLSLHRMNVVVFVFIIGSSSSSLELFPSTGSDSSSGSRIAAETRRTVGRSGDILDDCLSLPLHLRLLFLSLTDGFLETSDIFQSNRRQQLLLCRRHWTHGTVVFVGVVVAKTKVTDLTISVDAIVAYLVPDFCLAVDDVWLR